MAYRVVAFEISEIPASEALYNPRTPASRRARPNDEMDCINEFWRLSLMPRHIEYDGCMTVAVPSKRAGDALEKKLRQRGWVYRKFFALSVGGGLPVEEICGSE